MVDDRLSEAARLTLDAARAAGVMIVTVESCTGGLVAAALTSVAGSSDAVEGGFVTYSNAAKIRLGVPAALIDAHGAVSEEVARAMASAGVRAAPGVPVAALSITGVAGPGGGSPEKPVGLVHFAAEGRDGRALHRAEHFGEIGRDGVRAASVEAALALLREVL